MVAKKAKLRKLKCPIMKFVKHWKQTADELRYIFPELYQKGENIKLW